MAEMWRLHLCFDLMVQGNCPLDANLEFCMISLKKKKAGVVRQHDAVLTRCKILTKASVLTPKFPVMLSTAAAEGFVTFSFPQTESVKRSTGYKQGMKSLVRCALTPWNGSRSTRKDNHTDENCKGHSILTKRSTQLFFIRVQNKQIYGQKQ